MSAWELRERGVGGLGVLDGWGTVGGLAVVAGGG